MRVTSWRASHTSSRKVFGFFGGIVFSPYTSLLLSRSAWELVRPGTETGGGRGRERGREREREREFK